MPVFRLDPIAETEDSHHWRASTIKPVTVWVQAGDEADARQQLTTATIIATLHVPGQELAMPPWKDWGLVTCTADNSHAPPDGVILTADGRTLTVRERD